MKLKKVKKSFMLNPIYFLGGGCIRYYCMDGASTLLLTRQCMIGDIAPVQYCRQTVPPIKRIVNKKVDFVGQTIWNLSGR